MTALKTSAETLLQQKKARFALFSASIGLNTKRFTKNTFFNYSGRQWNIGLGILAAHESKKVLKLAGIKDVWVKSFGNTGMRLNLINAIFGALKKIYIHERGE